MANPRFTGLLLLLTGVLVLMGNTLDVLPPQAFWAGLLTYPIGGYLFFMGSRAAIEKSETRHAQALNPRLANDAGEAHAARQARSAPNPNAVDASAAAEPVEPERESRIVASLRRPPEAPPEASEPKASTPEPLAFHEIGPEDDEGMQVTTDVSFPVEIQEQRSIADQLEKLSKLQQQGIISAEEYAVAKAKLLD
jgi:hypothetical protein